MMAGLEIDVEDVPRVDCIPDSLCLLWSALFVVCPNTLQCRFLVHHSELCLRF